MHIENSLFFLPSPHQMHLVYLLTVLLMLVHLPYIGLVIGSSQFSIFFTFFDLKYPNQIIKRFSRDLMKAFIGNIWIVIGLGILPILSLFLFFPQMLFGANLKVARFILVVLSGSTIGLFMLYFYKRTIATGKKISPITLLMGALGLGLLISSYFIFISTFAIFLSPEHWQVIRTPVPMLFSWNVVARFNIFMVLSMLVTGLGILFYFFRWNSGDYEKFFKYFGAGLSIISIIALPIFVTWNIYTMPLPSFSIPVLGIYLTGFFLLLILSFSVLSILIKPEKQVGNGLLVCFFLLLLSLIVNDIMAHANAVRETNLVTFAKWELMKSEEEDLRGVFAGNATIEKGMEVFQTRCITCHSFDHKVVGPPYLQTLTKYINDQETLKAFIKNPTKINPSFPQMPKLGLRSNEVDSVVLYLFDEYNKLNKQQ